MSYRTNPAENRPDRVRQNNAELADFNQRVGQFIDELTFYWAQSDEQEAREIGPEQRRAIEYSALTDLIYGSSTGDANETEAAVPSERDITISDDAVRSLRLRQLLSRARQSLAEDEVGSDHEG